MASKWKCAYDSGRKFQRKWQEEFLWLQKASDDSENGFCKYCHTNVAARLSTIKDHDKSKKHQSRAPSKNMNALQTHVLKTPREQKKTVLCEEKVSEIELAVFVACHTSIRSVDHLGELMRKRGEGNVLGNVRFHRTKCASIIKNVLSPSLRNELRKAAAGKKFTLIVDESTDVGCQKLLCVTIKYLDDKDGIVDAFLGLVPVLETKAETLFKAIQEELNAFDLDLQDCLGFASDGASVMVGSNNSVWTRIKGVSPNCIQVRCICHSLALCIQHAFAKLPSNLGFMLKEVPSWFSHSNLRRDSFQCLFNALNSDTEAESGQSHPTPFLKTSATRWLVNDVLFNILVNWEELICYFQIAEIEAQSDCKFKAGLIKEMLKDRMNLLLFHFATPMVQEFERLNSLFQTATADPHELSKGLHVFHASLRSRLYNINGSKKMLEHCDLGAKFSSECAAYLESIPKDRKQAERERIQVTKESCRLMLQEALDQVEKRLPDSKELFSGLGLLSPLKVLSQVDRASFQDLPFQHLLGNDINSIEEQYRKIVLVDWSSEPIFRDTPIPKEAVPFWERVMETPFKNLAQYALHCHLTPTSNANIERIFSLVTSTKSKPRNRLGVSSLDAIIRIKAYVLRDNNCCNSFTVTQPMLDLCNSDMMDATSTNTMGEKSDETTRSVDEEVADLNQYL